MIKRGNTPFEDVITAATNISEELKSKDITISFDEDMIESYGECNEYEDGSIEIVLNAYTPVRHLVETLGHELAHAMVGNKHEHNEVWEKAFDDIFEEYMRYTKEKYHIEDE